MRPIVPHRTGRRRRHWSLLVLVVVALVGCSIPTSDHVEALNHDDYPELFGTTTTATTIPPEADPSNVLVDLFYVSGDQLEKVERRFAEGLKVNGTLQALTEPPTEEEAAQFDGRLVTELPGDLNPQPLSLDSSTLVYSILVDPGAGLRQLARENEQQASLIAGQITCTMTGLSLESGDQTVRVVGVQLYDSADEGADPIPITDSLNSLIEGPLEPRNFNDCLTGTELRSTTTLTTADG